MHANKGGVDDISGLVIGCVFADRDPQNAYENALAPTRDIPPVQFPTGCIQGSKEY